MLVVLQQAALYSTTRIDCLGHNPRVDWRKEILTLECAQPLVLMQVVLIMLDARLAAIKDLWQSGRLKSVGINEQHAVHLVEALFEHNENRKSVTDAIKGLS